MADTLTTTTTVSTVPSGTVIATDDAGAGGHVQIVKLALSADGSAAAVSADANGLYVQGSVADDAATATGNPVIAGAKAKAFDGTDPGSVAEGDAVNLVTDLNRRLLVNIAHPFFWRGNENNSAAQTNNPIVGAPGAGLSLYLQSVVMSTDTAMNILFVEDTGGTPTTILGPYYFAANGGMAFEFNPPIQVTANKDLGYTSSTAGNHTITVSGFTGP